MNEHTYKQKNFFKQLFKKQTKDEKPISKMDANQLEHTILDYYESFAQLHPDIILIFSLDGKVISPNNCLHEYLGYESDEPIVFKKLLTKDYYELAKKAFNDATEGETKTIGIRMCDNQGEQIYFSATFIPMKPQDGNIENIFLRLKDITNEKLLEKSNKLKAEKMIEMNDNYEHVFNHLNVGIWMSESLTGAITFASAGLADILQIPLLQIYEEPDYWETLIHPQYKEEYVEKYYKLTQGESIEHTYLITDGNGNEKWIYEQTIPRLDDTGEITHLFGMLTDVTDEQKMGDELRFLAKHDALTGLPNYSHLDDELSRYIENKQTETIALLYLEIDNFHWILDYLGYQIGDLVLTQIAERLKILTPENGYVAKVDRDSFVFLMRNYGTTNNVTHVAEEIMESIGKEISVKGYEFHVTASIGISFYPDNGTNKLVLMENAHTALYYAKHLGENNYQMYSFDRDISAHKKYYLERDLRNALQNEEFELFYQPQVDPSNGAIQSVEALIRWHHKEWGIVSPGEFITIAEEKHLIHQMEDWVFRTVCKQMRAWKDEGLPVYRMSLNLSPLRFLKPGFVEHMKQALADYEISPADIELEITESTLLENKINIEKTLGILKDIGLGIALDDFGKGYSSFHYLQTYDVNTIKIDKMFIQQLGSKDQKNESIVNSIIQLAKALHVKVVAEGVEELEQLEFLQQKDCDLIQGYLFSKPVPAEQLKEMLQATYLKPNKQKGLVEKLDERRKHFRFEFPKHLEAKMTLSEIDNQKQSMGSANVLIENISVGGLRFLSSLSVPMLPRINVSFHFMIVGESFNIDGELVYKVDEKMDVYSYGVKFRLKDSELKRLDQKIHEMILLKEETNVFPHTQMIKENPYAYLRSNRL